MAKVFRVGARFASNSWNEYADWVDDGSYDPLWPDVYHATEYNTFSQMADKLVRDGDGSFDDHENGMTIVFSAGNLWPPPAHMPPWPDPNPNQLTIAPGNAKNIISVGASDGWEDPGESRQCCGPLNGIPDCDDGAGDNISNVLAGSMRGTGSATDRFKPDLVAPGSRLRAAWSKGEPGSNPNYTCFGGTSASTPLVTGAAILIDAWYGHPFIVHPSPAMIKAMLTAHAADLGPGLEGGTDRYTGLPLPHSPSLAQGWGRLELDSLFSPDVETFRIDEDHRESGGLGDPLRRFNCSTSFWSENLVVDDPAKDVIIAMAYTDMYGAPNAEYPSVNNLNLVVIDGSGLSSSRYFGNKFVAASYYSRRYPSFEAFTGDLYNNVEIIRIDPSEIVNNGVEGDFTVKVKARTLNGKAVPGLDDGCSANQDFALYVFNADTPGGNRP